MKKYLLILLAAFIYISAFSEIEDVDAGHWAYKYVKNLESKGLLKLSDTETTKKLEGDKPLSRYEAAKLISDLVSFIADNKPAGVTAEEYTELKELVGLYTPEIIRLGGKTEELYEKIGESENKVMARVESVYGKRLTLLEQFNDSLKIKGKITANQYIVPQYYVTSMGGLTLGGQLEIKSSVNKDLNFYSKLNIYSKADTLLSNNDVLKNDYYLSPDLLKLTGKIDFIKLEVYKEKNRDKYKNLSLPENIGFYDGTYINPESGITIGANTESYIGKMDIKAGIFKKDDGDIYVAQLKNDISSLRSRGAEAFGRLSYAEKIVLESGVRNYKKSRSFLAFDGAINMNPVQNLNVNIAAEVANRTNLDYVPSEELAYNPIEATFFRTDIILKDKGLGKINAGIGYYSTGTDFDMAGMAYADETTGAAVKIFHETGLVKNTKDTRGYILKGEYDIGDKGSVIMSGYYAGRESVSGITGAAVEAQYGITYNVDPGKLQIKTIARKEANTGILSLEEKNMIVPDDGVIINTSLKYSDNIDKDNKEDTDNSIAMYADYYKELSRDLNYKFGLRFIKNGIILAGGNEKNGSLSLEAAGIVDVLKFKQENSDMGTLVVGGRVYLKDVAGTDADNSKTTKDEAAATAYLAHKITMGKLKLYNGVGMKYSAVNGIDSMAGNNYFYAGKLNYNFGNGAELGISYGTPEITRDSDLMKDMTSYAENNENKVKLNFVYKF